MSQLYDSKGGYAGYKKNNKEREALDFYSTPTEEVTNILNVMQFPINNKITILEPCAGQGHMMQGIYNYIRQENPIADVSNIIGTDVKDRLAPSNYHIQTGEKFDFLSKDYPYTNDIDYIIMNPPFSTIEPFIMRALEVANEGVLMFARLQFLEAESRFDKIFSVAPPKDVYVYVDRICCYKNGDLSIKPASVQAYAWYYFDTSIKEKQKTTLHWIRRNNKN